jgi:hypothetical protein
MATEDDTGEDTDETGEDEDTDEGTETVPPAGIPQSKVDELLKSRARKAERAALRNLAEETGMSVADLKNLAKDHQKRTESEKSEVDKAKSEAATAKAEAEAAVAKATRETLRARIATRLVTAETDDKGVVVAVPCRADRIGVAVDLALLADLDGEDDLDEQVALAVEHVRKSSPEWFASESEDDDNSNGDGDRSSRVRTPSSPVRRSSERQRKGGDSAKTRAQKRYEEMKKGRPSPKLFGSKSE